MSDARQWPMICKVYDNQNVIKTHAIFNKIFFKKHSIRKTFPLYWVFLISCFIFLFLNLCIYNIQFKPHFVFCKSCYAQPLLRIHNSSSSFLVSITNRNVGEH